MTRPAYTIDGADAPAEAFYALACDPRRSVVVEACAGAGKTWMLVSRIVRALLDGVEPQQILAITFTRKAAGEMRTRLDEWLAEWARPDLAADTREEALRQRGLGADEARRLAPALAGLQRRLLTSGRPVAVRTFHSWFAQLLSAAPLELLERLELPAAQVLIEDTAPLRPPLMRRFRARVAADAALRADHAVLVQRHRRAKVQAWLDAAWSHAAELQAADVAGGVEAAVPSAADWFVEFAGAAEPAELLFRPEGQRLLRNVAQRLGADGSKAGAEAADRLIDALMMDDPSAAAELVQRALFTDRGLPRKLKEVDGLADAIDLVQRVRDATLQQHAHDDHLRMLRLSRVLCDEYARLKRSRSLVDMADLERAAHALLSDPVLAGWVHERLDSRLRQVLIDEFQDTNPLQWQALRAWLAGYAGAGGGGSGQRPLSVFIVGDPKQSIYRFRRAEPRVFAAAQDFVAEALEGVRLACDHTRRCAPRVLAVVNDVFGDAVRNGEWHGFRPHSTASNDDGLVACLPDVPRLPRAAQELLPATAWRPSLTMPRREPELRRRQQELRHVMHGLQELLATPGWRAGDLMVLSRRRAVLAELSELLGAVGVPHLMPEDLAVAELTEAQDLIALLDVLASPGHDLSLARALKSPLFGASDEELLALSRAARQGSVPWRAALLAASPPPGTPLRRAAELLRRWSVAAEQLPPHELLDLLIDEGAVRERFLAVAPAARERLAAQAVDALLAAAGEQQGGRFATLYGFVRALKSGLVKVPAAPPSDAVQLLTVHGAKGLEARAVFVLDADPGRTPADLATVLVDWPPERAAPRSAAFFVPGAATPPSLRRACDEEMRLAEHEEINALYVAMTRARERLVLSRTEPQGGVERSWWARVSPLAEPWQPPDLPPLAATTEVLVPQLLALERPTPVPAPPPAESAQARLGRAIHRALEWASQQRNLVADEWPRLARAAASSFGLPNAAERQVLDALRAVLSGPRTGSLFDFRHLQWAGNEVPLTWQGQVLRADRVVQLAESGRWWVLDYKLAARPDEVDAYREQLRGYRAALQALQPGEPVHAAFVTADGRLLEI